MEEENIAKPEPVAICRLKRVAADHKDDIRARLPQAAPRNGKRVACVGAGPASLTVARDLAPLGYHVTVFDGEAKAGGFMWSQIPRFRLPESVIDEETGYITDMPHVDFVAHRRIDSMKALLAEDYDAVFVGCGAPRGRDLDIPGRKEAADSIHIGIDWLASVSFGHVKSGQAARHRARRRQHRDGLLPLGAAPGRQRREGHRAQRLRGDEGLALGEGRRPARRHPDHQLPCAQGLRARGRQAGRHELRDRRSRCTTPRAGAAWCPPASPRSFFACDEVLIAVGQENAFPWIERDAGIAVRRLGPADARMPTPSSRRAPEVFFGGDAAFGPKNIITAVAHGHEAAVSIDRFLHGEDVAQRPPPMTQLVSQKMGIHEWSYDNAVSNDARFKVPWAKAETALASIRVEVELGFDAATAFKEAQRCLNCDVQTVFTQKLCIECDACVDICPMDCITFTDNGDEADLRTRLKAPATQPDAGAVRQRAAEDRPRDGQGRGRLPALRPVRRALPHRRLGHAEVPAPDDAMPAAARPRRVEATA